jgi:transposase
MGRPINPQRPYPEEFKREAVELLRSSGRPLVQVARELGVSTESLRLWRKQAEIDAGELTAIAEIPQSRSSRFLS